eukprot:1015843-Pleurochrysis_carterae.AAC.1
MSTRRSQYDALGMTGTDAFAHERAEGGRMVSVAAALSFVPRSSCHAQCAQRSTGDALDKTNPADTATRPRVLFAPEALVRRFGKARQMAEAMRQEDSSI